jgi:chromosome segregation ATPase
LNGVSLNHTTLIAGLTTSVSDISTLLDSSVITLIQHGTSIQQHGSTLAIFQQDFIDLRADLSALSILNATQISGLQNQTATHTDRLATLTIGLAAANSAIVFNGTDITTLNSMINTNISSITTLNNSYSTINATVSSHQTTITAHTTDINTLQDEVSTINTTYATYDVAISGILDDLANRTTDLDALNQTVVDHISGPFDVLKNRVDNTSDYLQINVRLTDKLNLIMIYHNGEHPPRSEYDPGGIEDF